MGRGPEADDARLAQLLALIANVNRDPKRRRTPWTPDDVLPRRVPRPPAQVETLRPRIDAAMAAFGGVRRRPPVLSQADASPRPGGRRS